MIITLINLKKEKYKIIINDSITLKELKDIICSNTLIDAEFIRITSNGKIAHDNLSWNELNNTKIVFLNFSEVTY